MEGGKGQQQPEEGREEKRGQFFLNFFFEEKTVSVRVEERNGGFPVKSEGWGGWGWGDCVCE